MIEHMTTMTTCIEKTAEGADRLPPTTLSNDAFSVEMDASTGAIVGIRHPDDPYGMNWIIDPREAGQIGRSHCWGLGYAGMGGGIFWGRSHWDAPRRFEIEGNRCRITYEVSGLSIEVERVLHADHLAERYTFALTTEREHTMGGDGDGAFGIFTPWNDNYPDSATCVRARCNAHLWMGGADAWVCGLRMGGEAPHLGLLLDEGELDGYSIADRDNCRSSNHRGVIIVHPARFLMRPGMSRSIGWRLFWHQGRDDFHATLARHHAPRLDADRLVALDGETITLRAHVGSAPRQVRLTAGDTELSLEGEGPFRQALFRPAAPGEQKVLLKVDGLTSRLEAFHAPPIEELLLQRCRFIACRQQVLDDSAYHGAFVPYDNELDRIIYSPGQDNHSGGGEAVGMGVLLALQLQRGGAGGEDLRGSLDRHYRFVHERLQRPDGTVLYHPGQGEQEHLRLYNFPWVAHYHLEMARLELGAEGVRRAVAVMRSYYRHGGADFVALPMPMFRLVQACHVAGLDSEAEEMQQAALEHAERILEMGTSYPSHEVAYEQSIVAPACDILLQAYQLGGGPRFLEGLAPHLACLESFNGAQPSHHLREIGIRHWDGFWFGKRKLWGDTFPHYWSTLTALVFARLAIVTGDSSYATRARTCLRGNLSLFTPDGRASCAHVYPRTVNGQRAACNDPLANDQDWALIHWIWVEEILANKRTKN
jgi:hypothetical protein